jgi:hypothetical protein
MRRLREASYALRSLARGGRAPPSGEDAPELAPSAASRAIRVGDGAREPSEPAPARTPETPRISSTDFN